MRHRPVHEVGKHAWRAIRAIFAGTDDRIAGAIKAIPYERDMDDWALYPCLGGITKFIVVQGVFPLMHAEDELGESMKNTQAWEKVFKAIGAEATKWADESELAEAINELKVSSTEETSPPEDQTKEYTPELVVNHGYDKIGENRVVKFKVKWEGFEKVQDQTWHTLEDLPKAMHLVEDYMELEGLTVEQIETVPWDELNHACSVQVDPDSEPGGTWEEVKPADSEAEPGGITYLPEPPEEESSDVTVKDHRFADYLPNAFKDKVFAEIKSLVEKARYEVQSVDLDIGELYRRCDQEFQDGVEQMLRDARDG